MDQSFKSKIEQSARTAEEFTKLYYDSVDKRRHLIAKLYLDTGLLSWNGNGISGIDRIQKFYMDLPSSDHTMTTLDAHPVLDEAVNGQLTFMIQVSGTVRYQDKSAKTFQQNFIITAQGDKWKIVTDCFRLQEPIGRKYVELLKEVGNTIYLDALLRFLQARVFINASHYILHNMIQSIVMRT